MPELAQHSALPTPEGTGRGNKSSRPRPPKWGVRPEDNRKSAHEHYADAEAARYTETGHANHIQAELALRAVQCLGLPKGAPCLLADLGCGSGLSTAALLSLGGSRHAVVGLDAAGGMLSLAAQDPALRGCLARSDFGQGLPLRRASLQGAISVSALQWLFAAPDPARATRRFFADLHAALEPGARAAFQLYLPGDVESRALLRAAASAGLRATYFVDFPHPTPAKKYYLCVRRDDRTRREPSHGHPPCCPLAWPHTAACTLSWAAGQGLGSDLDQARTRLRAEHARHAAHALRMLRRAARAFLAARGAEVAAAGATRSEHLARPGSGAMVPCGAPLHAWCSVVLGPTTATAPVGPSDAEDSIGPAPDSTRVGPVADAITIAEQLGIPGAEEWVLEPGPAPPPAPPYLAALQLALEESQTGVRAPRPDPWLWLEPVPWAKATPALPSPPAQTAVLHAAKQAPLVVSLATAGETTGEAVGRACAALGAAVVGLEAEGAREGAIAAWLVHVPAPSGEQAARAWQRAWQHAWLA
ncbi:hypothetical protein ACKKBG_A21520 [Auxenochlorella protothecoides x Auxenochlorella symbiontica]